MQKFFITLAVTSLLTSVTIAQKPRLGFNAGILFAVAKVTADNQTNSSKNRAGFNIGVMADIPLASSFSFQPGLSFLQKGGKDSENDGVNTAQLSISINYLELPLNLVYQAKGKMGAFNIGAGPSLSYGLSGKIKVISEGLTISEKIKFGSNVTNDDLKRFEFGGNILAGYEFTNGLSLTLNYNIGFSNVSADPQSKWKNYYGGLRIGYFLKNKKK